MPYALNVYAIERTTRFDSSVGTSPAPTPWTVTVAPGFARTVIASGDIDVGSAPSIEAALRQVEAQLEGATGQLAATLVIDVTDVGFIDSSGLRALLSASRRNARLDRRVVLRSPGNALKRLLEITGTATMFDLD